MSRIDSLPPDQRAVLQLLLQRGSRYGELASLLNIDEAEVRRRAHGALEALAAGAPGVGDERRAQISDYLLGQQSGAERAATRGFLEGSAGGRGWAQAVAAELRDVAGDRLPDVPAEPDDPPDGGAGAVEDGPDGERAAAAVAAAAAGPAVTDASAAAAAFGAVPAAPDAAPDPDPRAGAPRISRRAAAVVLGALLLAAVAVVLVFVVRDSGQSPKTAAPAANTTATTRPRPQVIAQANLVPPSARTGSKALGVVLVQRVANQRQLIAAAQGLSKSARGGYGIWLYSSPAKAKWLGFFATRDTQGRLLARGVLKEPITDYREVLVTREARRDPPQPGPIFLRGPIRVPSRSGG